MAMDGLQKMLQIPLDFPPLVMTVAERSAVSNKTCVGYLQAVENDIVLRVFAFRRHKGKAMEITEIMRRITRDNRYITKNLYGYGMQGYIPVYEEKDVVKYYYGYKQVQFSKEYFDLWEERDGKVLGIWYRVLNPDMLKDTQSFKYCGYAPSVTDDVIEYLNEYIEHPSVEYFGKLGIKPTPTLIRKAEKDKAFRHWLFKTKIDCFCGPQAIIYAYEHNIGVAEAKKICHEIDYLNRWVARDVEEIKGTKIDRKRVRDYIKEKDIFARDYNDYLKALKKLGYDLTDTKNLFPYDFKTMHDLRVAEYDSAVAKEDREKRAKLYAKFEAAARLSKPFEYKDGCYAAIIPEQIEELIREGKELHHCVGKMGYDLKMANGEIVIVFIRSVLDIEKPLATVEYDLKRHYIRQLHGDYNNTPADDVRAFVDEWAQRTTEILEAKKGA